MCIDLDGRMSLKVIHFQSMFLIYFIINKTDLCAEIWNTSPNCYAAENSKERRNCSKRSRRWLSITDIAG